MRRVAWQACAVAAGLAVTGLTACAGSGGSGSGARGPTQAVWKLRAIPIETACDGSASTFVESVSPPRTDALPARLSDHIPDVVPVAGWRPVVAIPLTPGMPGEDVSGAQGWTRGFTTTFNALNEQGGIVTYVLEYGSSAEAINDAAAYHAQLVCDRGLDAFAVEGHRGIIVSKGFEHFVASWVHGARRIDVRSQLFSDPANEARNALLGAEATWKAG